MLLRDIQSGHYPEGSYLPSESALMKEFGVGRPAIRDSLAKLARLGLVELKPGVRPKVCKLDVAPLLREVKGVVHLALDNPAGQRNLQQVRLLLESALARHAARIIRDDQLQVTQLLLEEFRRVVETEPLDSQATIDLLSDLDFQFHRSIVEVVGNPLVAMLQQSLVDWLVDQRTSTLGYRGQPETTYAMHKRIFTGLSNHDPDLAETAMIEHLEQVNQLYHQRH